MRHLKSGRKLNRTSAHRKALMRNLANALISNRSIKTTLPKAKELRPFIEQLVTIAVRKSKQSKLVNNEGEAAKLNSEGLALRRLLFNRLRNRNSVVSLCDEIVSLVGERPGGYTRIVKTGYRLGDSAPMAIIEFVDKANEAADKASQSTDKTSKSEDKADAASG